MTGLLKNEIQKVWKQGATRVFIIIVAALILLTTPVVQIFNRIINNFTYGAQDTYDSYMESAEWERSWYKDSDDEISDADKKYSEMYALSYEFRAESIKFFIDNGLADSWEWDLYQYSFENAYFNMKVIELAKSGKYSLEMLCSGPFGGVLYSYNYDPDTNSLYEYDEDTGDKTPIDINNLYNELKAEVDLLKDEILKADLRDLMKADRDLYKQKLDICKEDLKIYNDRLYEESFEGEKAYLIDATNAAIDTYVRLIAAYDQIIDENVEYDSWKYNVVTKGFTNAVSEYCSTVVMPESVFLNSPNASMYKNNYKSYLDDIGAKHTDAENALKIFEYSLAHNISIPDANNTSAKQSWQQHLVADVSFIQIFAVIVAGIIVGNEFSSGTIRLLVIRPRKRSKILTSKLLCVGFWSLLLMVFAVVVLFIMNLAFDIGGDIFAPDLRVIGGKVVALPSILITLQYLAYAAMPMIFSAMLAFFLSSFTRKSALAIAIPIAVDSLLSAVSLVIAELIYLVPWMKYTPLPYYELTPFIVSPTASYFSSVDWLGGLTVSPTGLYPGLGVVMSLAISAGLIALSYLSFTKRQIKN